MLTLFKSDTPEMRNPWFQVAKPRVLGRETMGFRGWKQGFQTVKWCLSHHASLFAYLCKKCGELLKGFAQRFFEQFLMGIVSFVVSLNKIGCTSTIKTNKFVLYCLRFALSLKKIRTEATDEHLIRFFFKMAVRRMEEEIEQKKTNTQRFRTFVFWNTTHLSHSFFML